MKVIGQHSGRIEVGRGLKAVQAAADAARRIWKQACEHDGIDPASSFVVFSDDNPYVKWHGLAMTEYWARIREYQSGGYVGLRIA